jgi:hypothetical protein
MKQPFLLLFLFILFQTSTVVYGQGGFCNEKPDILNIDLPYDSIESISSTTKNLNKVKGFPVLDCSFRDGGCEFPKDRYLVKSTKGNYFVIDSKYKIKIDASDSIIAFSYNVNIEDSLVDYTCSPDYRGKKKIYYQAIRNGLTTLYDYQGNSITSTSYLGEIFDNYYQFYCNNSFWVTINHSRDSTTMGLIDSTGKTILSQESITNRFISQFDLNFNRIWCLRNSKTNEISLFDAKLDDIILTYDGLESYKINYDVLIFKWKGKFGIYHPLKGIIIPPKFENIKMKKNSGDSLVLIKGRRESNWIVPEEIKEYYKIHKLTI